MYKKIFDPLLDGAADKRGCADDKYVYTENTVLVVNAALVTGRPILVRGPSGTGKSTLARDVARWLRWDFEYEVITSEHTAQDLKWKVDNVGRLAKAQAGERDPEQMAFANFVVPGPLWWAFARASAHEQFNRGNRAPRTTARDNDSVVLLLDEIDKADPDLPNGLLEPLEEGTFSAPEVDAPIKRWRPSPGEHEQLLVFLTSNDERRLPGAFLRRCLELTLEYPDKNLMNTIAKVHQLDADFAAVWTAVFGAGTKMTLGTAEFLDTLKAYSQLKDAADEADLLKALVHVTAWKHGREKPVPGAAAG